jgi:hypothetical protein
MPSKTYRAAECQSTPLALVTLSTMDRVLRSAPAHQCTRGREEDTHRQLPHIQPVKLTNVSKAQLIQRLIVAVEQRQIGWPAAWTTLTDEMKRYEYEITANGNITYNAPSGYHDDCVIALALANSERFQFKWTGEVRVFPSAPRAARLLARGRVLAG